MKTVAVYGSTGSIGVQTLNVVRRFPHEFRVVALAAGKNTALLEKQAAEFCPDLVSSELPFDAPCKAFCGKDAALCLARETDADITVMAISGVAALGPLCECIKRGKRIALANKEAIVCAGELVLGEAKRCGAEIIPVDSEHSAVFQCLSCGDARDVRRIILTASGGPFYFSRRDLSSVTPEEAVRHPTWNMGAKISIDSATMVNKGLEIIEAGRLFGTNNVDYVIHPESVIHSMVEFADGSTAALMSYPDMELAIQYALTYPRRAVNAGVRAFDFARPLTFAAPDEDRFPAPAVARRCLAEGGTAPAVYSLADEAAVRLFMKKLIRFTDITGIIEEALCINETVKVESVPQILELAASIERHFGA